MENTNLPKTYNPKDFESRLYAEWMEKGSEISWGPAPTEFGIISISFKREGDHIKISWEGKWYGEPPEIEVRFPGQRIFSPKKNEDTVLIPREVI